MCSGLRDRRRFRPRPSSRGTRSAFDLVVGADGRHSAGRGNGAGAGNPAPRRARQLLARPRPRGRPEADRYLLHELGPDGRAAIDRWRTTRSTSGCCSREDGSPRPAAEQRLERVEGAAGTARGRRGSTVAAALSAGGRPPVAARVARPGAVVPRPDLLIVARRTRPRRTCLRRRHGDRGLGGAARRSSAGADRVGAALETFLLRRFDRCRLVVEPSAAQRVGGEAAEDPGLTTRWWPWRSARSPSRSSSSGGAGGPLVQAKAGEQVAHEQPEVDIGVDPPQASSRGGRTLRCTCWTRR